MKSPLWKPNIETIKNSNMWMFLSYINEKYDKNFSEYSELYQWSIDSYAEFWKSLLEYSQIIVYGSAKTIIDNPVMPGASWFPDLKLNYAENLFRFRDDKIAIISSRENQKDFFLTYHQLFLLVAKSAAGLKKLGVKKGSIVAAVIPNIPEAVILMLATASIGAVWTSTSPEFGHTAILDKFSQINPDVLVAVKSYYYNGKHFHCEEKYKLLTENIKSINSVIIVNPNNNFSSIVHEHEVLPPGYLYFNNLIDNDASTIEFEKMNFNDPLFILYSSGTTGLPKCIVHSVGGTLLQHYKELVLHTGLKRNDTIFFFTTCGWMMWNWLISSLMTGAAIFLYDGNPFFPETGILWDKVEEYKISVFGTSPKYLINCENSGLIPKNHANLSSLRVILSTGAPLHSKSYKYVYSNIKKDVLLSSISGGTDIISCFMLGNPLLPVYSEEIQCRGLGMAVKAFDENGNEVYDEQGELVCTLPFPSMPLYFLNDKKYEKYKSSYFEKYPGVWHHGDFISITQSGRVVVYGRSDTVLNPGGVRIGTAELYRIVEDIDYVEDAIAVGYLQDDEEVIYLFLALKNGKYLNQELADSIKKRIKLSLSPRHVPDKIFQVPEIPKTFNGKKVEVAVSKIINGRNIDNLDAISNPNSLSSFYSIRQSLTHKY